MRLCFAVNENLCGRGRQLSLAWVREDGGGLSRGADRRAAERSVRLHDRDTLGLHKQKETGREFRVARDQARGSAPAGMKDNTRGKIKEKKRKTSAKGMFGSLGREEVGGKHTVVASIKKKERSSGADFFFFSCLCVMLDSWKRRGREARRGNDVMR